MARRLAREAGVWTVVLGDFTQAGDSLHLAARVYDVASGKRVDVARVDDRAGRRRAPPVRPARRQAARPLGRAQRGPDRARAVHHGVARGVPRLPRGRRAAQPLGPRRRRAGAASGPSRSTPPSAWPTTSSRSPAGWLVGTGDSIADARHRARHRLLGQPARARPHRHQRLPRLSRRRISPTRGRPTSSCSPATRPTPTPGTAWARRGSTTPPARTRRPPGPRRSAPSSARWRSIPTTRWPTITCRRC